MREWMKSLLSVLLRLVIFSPILTIGVKMIAYSAQVDLNEEDVEDGWAVF